MLLDTDGSAHKARSDRLIPWVCLRGGKPKTDTAHPAGHHREDCFPGASKNSTSDGPYLLVGTLFFIMGSQHVQKKTGPWMGPRYAWVLVKQREWYEPTGRG